jgi:mannan endo-1,4-beta-mannosidase
MSPSTRARSPWRAALAGVTAAVVGAGVLTAVPAAATPLPAAPLPAAPVEITDPQVDLVDDEATDATRSLFAYLRDVRGQGMLFGHQHTTDYGETFAERDGTSSDVLAATGDYPAVFGFDTLIIEGRERPGRLDNTREENALILADSIREAHDVGAISTLSVHMENFVTGGDFYDTSGDTLRAVLPGGSHHDDLVEYLDLIALAADNAVDENGDLIPVLFRPWHENAGSWFWWGAAFGTPGEYRELFRFTVEYLRDVKGVHNFLYGFSPGSGFGGDAETYLRTYPGDDFIDLLGYDVYDEAASPAFLDGLTTDLAMIADLADERGKISALTEFGITGGVQPDGENANPTWYTDVLGAIEADPGASRTAYMLTWANFGESTTPYTPTEGEMLADFLDYHADEYSYFAPDVVGAFGHATTPVAERPTAHLASPADGGRVAAAPVELRASVAGYDADRVVVEVDAGAAGTAVEVELTPPADGGLWWTGTWEPAEAELDNSTRNLTVRVYSDGAEVATEESAVIVGPRPEPEPGEVDDFEDYGDDTALRAEYVQYNTNDISLVRAADGAVGDGDKAMRLDYSFATQSYTGVGKQLGTDWSDFESFEAWVDPDGSANKLVLQIVAGGVYYEAYPSLEGDEPFLAEIPFADWRPAPWDTANADRRLTDEDLAEVTQFNVYVNAAESGDGAAEGSIVVDGLRAVLGDPAYRDVPRSSSIFEAVEWLHDDVVDLGDRRGRFHPLLPVSRATLLEVLDAYAPDHGLDVGKGLVSRIEAVRTLWALAGSPEPTETASYRDVRDADAAAVSWAVQAGVMDPVLTRWFGSYLPLVRGELATALYAVDQIPGPVEDEVLFDFAADAQGWYVPDWAGAATMTAAGGRLVLDVEAADGTWAAWNGSLDLTGRSALVLDVPVTDGFDTKVALQLGTDWTWCETAQAGWVDDSATGEDALAVDLTTLTEECAAMLGDVHGINVFLNTGHH